LSTCFKITRKDFQDRHVILKTTKTIMTHGQQKARDKHSNASEEPKNPKSSQILSLKKLTIYE